MNILTLETSSTYSKKKIYSLLAKIIISAGLIIFLVYKIKLSEIATAIKSADYVLVTISFLLLFLNLYLQYARWKMAANKILGDIGKKEIFLSLFYGLTGGAFTPARLGEYWGRSLPIKNKTLIQVIAATIVDKIFPLVIVLISGIAGTSWFYYVLGKVSITIPVIVTIICLFTLIILILKNDKILKLVTLLKKIPAVQKHQNLIESVTNLDRSFIINMTLISALFYFCYIFQFALLTAAFSHNMYIGRYLLAGVMVMFSKTLLGSVSLSEFGIREGASVYFLSLLGELPGTGFNASIFLFMINVVIPSLFGMLLMLAGKNGK